MRALVDILDDEKKTVEQKEKLEKYFMSPVFDNYEMLDDAYRTACENLDRVRKELREYVVELFR